MITLLHGDDIQASRNELHRRIAAAPGRELREVNGRSIEPALLVQALESSSLFGSDRLVIIENLFGKLGRKTSSITTLAKILEKSSASTDVILWEDTILGSTALKALGYAQVKLFKMPAVIFQLLDGLRPKSATVLIPLVNTVISLEPPEVLYTLLVRRVRQLIQVSQNVSPVGLAPWQATRLTAQARLFTMNELVNMHATLLAMDIGIKTGSSPFTLTQQIEQFIISI